MEKMALLAKHTSVRTKIWSQTHLKLNVIRHTVIHSEEGQDPWGSLASQSAEVMIDTLGKRSWLQK